MKLVLHFWEREGEEENRVIVTSIELQPGFLGSAHDFHVSPVMACFPPRGHD